MFFPSTQLLMIIFSVDQQAIPLGIHFGGTSESRLPCDGQLPQPQPSSHAGAPAQHSDQTGGPRARLSHQLGQTCARSVVTESIYKIIVVIPQLVYSTILDLFLFNIVCPFLLKKSVI